MWIGRISVFGYLLDWIAVFFMDSESHRNYLVFPEERLIQVIGFFILDSSQNYNLWLVLFRQY